MNIIFFAHPDFLGHQSMPRYAQLLIGGMKERGHEVKMWTPKAYWFRLPAPNSIKKWLSYIDQYAVFPAQVNQYLKSCPPDTLFVFTDHALGPWVPLVANRFHVVHCHDFLAQLSALNRIPGISTSWTGKQYQAFIHRGYSTGKNFISVSQKTRDDLHQFLPRIPIRSEVVYNALNQPFGLKNLAKIRALLSKQLNLDLSPGYLLHVGGNQWYKNRIGVIEIYNSWRATSKTVLPLVMIGTSPSEALAQIREKSSYAEDIHFLTDANDELVRSIYSGATVFLFPSIAEGFGWPIAEAMASGCPVITTQEAPMTEVGASVAFYIPRRPATGDSRVWAITSAQVVQQVISLSPAERKLVVEAGLVNTRRFEPAIILDEIEAIYQSILEKKVSE